MKKYRILAFVTTIFTSYAYSGTVNYIPGININTENYGTGDKSLSNILDANTLYLKNENTNLINMSGENNKLSIIDYTMNATYNGGCNGCGYSSNQVGILLNNGANIKINSVDYTYSLNNPKDEFMESDIYQSAFYLNDKANMNINKLNLNIKKGNGADLHPNGFYLSNNSKVIIEDSNLTSDYLLFYINDSEVSLSNTETTSANEIIMNNSTFSMLENSTFNTNGHAFSFNGGDNILNIRNSTINNNNKKGYAVFYVGKNSSNNINIENSENINSGYLIYSSAKNENDKMNTTLNIINSKNIKGNISSATNNEGKNSSSVSLNLNNSDWSGNIYSSGNSTVKLTLNNNSIWNGTSYLSKDPDSKTIITLNNGVWNLTGGSATSEIISENSSIINLKGNNLHSLSLVNKGTLLTNDKDANYQSITTITGNVYNSGLIYIDTGTETTGKTLQVNGNWDGENGTVFINTTLNGDTDSSTDKLIINGNVSGTTLVSIKNQGGNGAKTIEGIEVISTENSSENAFKQSGRIIAGSYEYHLQQGTASGDNKNNWYLTSADTTRPESGSYIGNLQAAGTMFNTTLKDRQGGGTYINPVTGEVYTSSVWARSVGSHQKGNISDGQSDYTANKFVYQMGGDVINGSLQGNDEYHIGLMAGYGNQHNRSHNHVSGYNSKGSLWGYSAGFYGTWYQDAKTNTGLYVDSWVLYNWFNNSVHGDKLEYENYKTKGFTASIESGYSFKLGTYPSYGETTNTVYITPQAQAIWSGVKADKHKESNGTNVEGLGNNNVQTRLGVRLSIVNEGKNLETLPVRPLMPFVEANWIYTSKQYGVSMDNEKAYFEGTRNIGEVKAGLEADLSHNVTVWGNIAQQFGSHSYQNTQGMLGVKYAF